MANLADIVTDDSSSASLSGNSETARKALTQAVTSSADTQTQATEPTGGKSFLETPLTDGVPDKFKGKTVKDILDSYTNLESAQGRMANELGTQRQLTDRLLDLKRDGDLSKNGAAPVRQKLEVTAAEILDKPSETLDRVLTQREAQFTQVVDQRLQRLEMNQAEAAFKQRHNDFQAVVTSDDFGNWVRSSPIRLRAAAAANQGNWQIADELLSEFKGGRQSTTTGDTATTSRTTQTADLDGARRSTLESSGGRSSDGTAKAGTVYKRTDLMRLRIEDPEAYYDEGFQAEILRAHAEKRVV